MTGCGCGLVVATLGVLLSVLIFGSTDPGEPMAQALRLAAVPTLPLRLLRSPARCAAGGSTRREITRLLASSLERDLYRLLDSGAAAA